MHKLLELISKYMKSTMLVYLKNKSALKTYLLVICFHPNQGTENPNCMTSSKAAKEIVVPTFIWMKSKTSVKNNQNSNIFGA